MASTEKVSDQLKFIKDRFSISNHTFLNKVVDGLKRKFADVVPGMQLKFGNKQISGVVITAQMSGTTVVESQEDLERAANNVRQTMDGLKNQSDLISLVE